MAGSVNKVILVGNLGRDPETKPMQDGRSLVNMSVATSENWRDKGSGEQLSKTYRSHGLAMLPEHATWPDGGYSREAAIMEINERMTTGRFKVAAHLQEWFEEYRMYHRKDGLIVAERDDIMSATEKIVMMKRYAKPVPLGNKQSSKRRQQFADGIDFDLS